MDKLLELKKNYNELLKKNKKAEEFITNCTDEEYEKWLPLFLKRTREISMAAKEIEQFTGKKMISYERLNGFKL